MTTLYCDFNDRGHHPRHIEHILKLSNCTILTSRATVTRIGQKVLATSNLEVVCLDVHPQDFPEQIEQIRLLLVARPEFKRCIHLAIDDVYCAYLFSYISRPWRIPLSGVWMSCNTFYSRNVSVRSSIKFNLLVASWYFYGTVSQASKPHLYFLNEELHQWLIKQIPSVSRWTSYLYDPPDATDLQYKPAHSSWASSCDSMDQRPVIAFLGVHTPRKGTTWALAAFRGWRGMPIRIVVAGEWREAASIESCLANLPSNVEVTFDEGYVPSSKWEQIVSQADVIAVPYILFGGSSGVVVSALQRGKKVIASDYGLVGFRLRKISPKFLFRHLDSNDFLRTLEELLLCDFQTLVGPDFAVPGPEQYRRVLSGSEQPIK